MIEPALREHRDVPLANTLGITAHARRLIDVLDVDALPAALVDAGQDALLLGSGSNLLIVAPDVDAVVRVNGHEKQIGGEGNGPLSAFVDALAAAGFPVRVLDYSEHALSSGGDALAAAYVEVEVGSGDDATVLWGVGRHSSIVTASMKAVVSAINRSDRN